MYTSRKTGRKPEASQKSIASFFTPVQSRLTFQTPNKTKYPKKTSSSLVLATQNKGAFDEITSSDTLFGSPEVLNFRNPLLARVLSNLTSLPDKAKGFSEDNALFVESDDEAGKENRVPTSLKGSPRKLLKRDNSSLLDFLDGVPRKKLTKANSSASRQSSVDNQSSSVKLSSEQLEIMEAVVNRSENVFFTGSAGTGKSVVLRELVQRLHRKHGAANIGVTASTGLAACNIGGQTVHKFLSLGLGTGSVGEISNKIKRNGLAKKRWTQVKVLIIDEISMIDGSLFAKIDQIAQIIRGSPRPFGGIQLVCTGDFFQLPPVSRDRAAQFCFQSDSWKRGISKTITLTQVFRQKGDTELIDMLNALRKGQLDDTMIRRFHQLNRKVKYTDGIEPTELYPTRQEVKAANENRMRQLPAKPYIFKAQDSDQSPQFERLYENLMCEKVVELKVGSQVMYLKNHPDNVVVNGSIGNVVGFSTENFWGNVMKHFGPSEMLNSSQEFLNVLKFLFGRLGLHSIDEEGRNLYENIPTEWRAQVNELSKMAAETDPQREVLPVVNFKSDANTTCIILVRREEFLVDDATVMRSSAQSKLVRTQIPLLLAWAMSIHKAQGQSIDRLRVDLRRIFEKGQVYVALSRATNKEHLEVLNFDHRRIQVAPEVKEFYALIMESSVQAAPR